MPSRCRGAAVLLAAVLLLLSPATAIRHHAAPFASTYAEAPHFADGEKCPLATFRSCATPCDPSHVHVAMTLDAAYLRGSIAAVHSILKHADCPSLLFFHFVSSDHNSGDLRRTVAAAFPSLRFKIYRFDPSRVSHLISTALRSALEEPLNYARNYLADLIEPCVKRVVYLDSDVVAVDDVRRLYNSPMAGAVIGAPEYCHADFARYFTAEFWGGGNGSRVFEGRRRKPCYFNTGVMVIDLDRWRSGDYTARIEGWMREQREKRIYELGSLPPFLLVFAGEVAAVEHRWNQHGLGGDNEGGRCRKLHPGPVSLLHWSGKGKPWDRLDAGVPCDVDRLWEPYDLYRPATRTTAAPAAVFSW